MIDIETLGNASDTVVLSVGAAAFNKEGIIGEYYEVLNHHEQLQFGRSVSGSTLDWWMKQKDEARTVFNVQKDRLSVGSFIYDFEEFIDEQLTKVKEKRDQLKPWGNGANFDITIMEDLWRAYHPKGRDGVPWAFWNVWCFRTFNHMTKCKDLVKREGVHHNALDDAIYQAKCVIKVLNKGKV